VSDDTLQKLLRGGIKAAQQGQYELARKAFLQVLKQDPNNEGAWLGMATVAEAQEDKLRFLNKLLEINPQNERAQEALRRLGILAEDAAGQASVPPVEDDERGFIGLSDADEGSAPPAQGTGDGDESAQVAGDEPPFQDQKADENAGVIEDYDSFLEELASVPLVDDSVKEFVEEEAGSAPRISLQAAFAAAPPPPRGQGGVPVPDREKLDAVAQEAQRLAQAYLERTLAEYAAVEWVEKRRGLAGRREYGLFIVQVAAGIVVFLGIVAAITASAVLNNPEARAVIFAPTHTPTFTPTFTPTATPGVTNTPSPTPELTLTPSPTIPPTVTPGNPDPNFPPQPTDVYIPQGLGAASRRVEQAVGLLEENQLNEAFELLETEREGLVLSGNLIPSYFLSILQLEQNNPQQARLTLDNGVEAWRESPNFNVPYDPLVEVGYARVDLFEAEQALQAGNTNEANDLLEGAEERINTVIDTFDAGFADAYILLSQRHLLADNPDEALAVLTEAINSEVDAELFTNTDLRMQRARIYMAQEDYDRALQELHDVLFIDPFLEEALDLQVMAALENGQPGLGVLLSQEYLLYYPDSVRGFFLQGLARQQEGKTDLALNAFARGLQGNPDSPAYLDILLNRAEIFMQQRRFELAQADYTEALQLSGNDPDIRIDRMTAAYFAGDLQQAEADANILLEDETVPNRSAVLLIQARVLVDTSGGEEDFEDAIILINRAINQEELSQALRPIADEYLARAQFALEDLNDALTSIERALEAEETGTRRFIRAQILEARGREHDDLDDLVAARDEYEFTLTWGSIFPYPFLDEASARYTALEDRIEDLKAEAQA